MLSVCRMRKINTAIIAILLLGAPILAFWIGGAAVEFREMRKTWASQSTFSQIRLGLLYYHREYGRFPPTKYQIEANGPIHSWRILILPYKGIHAKKQYSKYDFCQAWNSAHNLAVAQSRSSRQWFSVNDDEFANYLAVGEEDRWPTWPGYHPLKALLIKAGEDRFLLVEYPDSHIYWTEPRY